MATKWYKTRSSINQSYSIDVEKRFNYIYTKQYNSHQLHVN